MEEKKVNEVMLSSIAWHTSPEALKEMQKLWGFTAEDLEKYRKGLLPHWIRKHGHLDDSYQKARFEGDSIAAFLRKEYDETGQMPEPLQPGTDPAQETYLYLEKRGFEVCIPAD